MPGADFRQVFGRIRWRGGSSGAAPAAGPSVACRSIAMNGRPDVAIFDPASFRLAADEAALIEKARAFGARVLAPRAAQHDREASFPIENFSDMHKEGLLAICVPREEGG